MFGLPGGWEMVVVGIIALLLFGKRLPEVARSLGKGLVEFKKGMQDITEDVTSTVHNRSEPPPPPRPAPPREERETVEVAVPRFEPPTAPPA